MNRYRDHESIETNEGINSIVIKDTAASIWFDIWGLVDPDKTNCDFHGNFRKISISPANFPPIPIFQAKISDDLLLVINSRMSVYPWQIILIILFLFKGHHFLLCMTVHDNI